MGIRPIFSFIKRVIEPLNIYYCADLFGIKGICKWIEWTYIVKCPKCDSDIVLLEKNKKKNGYYICPNKNCECHNGVARTKCIPKNSIPIRIKYTTDSSKVSNIHILSQKEIECLLKYENKLNKELDSYTFPSFKIPLNWDRQKEDKLYEKGGNKTKSYKKLVDILADEGIYEIEVYTEYKTMYIFTINSQYLENAMLKAGIKKL